MWIKENMINQRGDKIAIVEQSGQIYTYESLFNDIEEFKKKIQNKDKQLILVLAENNYQSIVAYLAALQNEDSVMLINAELESNLVKNIIDSYQPAIIFGDYYHPEYQEVDKFLRKRQQSTSYKIHKDLALLLSTSGTTGSIKFVRLSYKNLVANADSIVQYLNISEEDRGLANLPIHYSYGLSIINSHLSAGSTILLTNDSVLSKNFWHFVKNEKATSFAGVPYTYQMLYRIGFHKMEFPHLRYFTQAGGRLSENLVLLFGEYAKRNKKRFYVMYGQTEATARISFVPPEILLEKPMSIGKPIPGGDLELDPDTNELIYSGPNVMLGYARDYKDLDRGDELNGILNTGDIADTDDEGYYYIKGRKKRFIKLFGLRLNLDDIEKQLEKVLQTFVGCVGTDEKMIVVTDNPEIKENIENLIQSLYKLHKSSFRVKIIEEFPRLANGKLNYEVIKELVL